MSATGKNQAVAAVILNYFGAPKTLKCLQSLAAEPLGTVYLVDNSADSEEFSRLESGLGGLPADFRERIRLIENPENLGFGRAINQAIRYDCDQTGGHLLYLLLNNDTEVQPGLVDGLSDKMRQDPAVALAAPRLIYPDFELTNLWYYRFVGHVTSKPRGQLAMPFLTGCCLLVDACLVKDGVLFDDDFFMYGEDIWLNWRVQEAGRSTASAPNLELIHEGTGSSKKGNLFYEYHTARGHVLLAGKMIRHWWEMPLTYAGRVAYLLARAVVRSVRHKTMVPLLAYGMCWFDLRVRPGVR